MKLRCAGLAAMSAGMLLAGQAGAESASAKAPPSRPIGAMTTGYTYYNRPGADMAAHDSAVKACAAEAMKLHYAGEGRPLTYVSPQPQPGMTAAQTAGVGIVANLAVDAIIIQTQKVGHIGAVAAGLENCMVVRGWRVVTLPPKEGRALAAMPQAELAKALEPWVGAETPHGTIMRTFGNELDSGLQPRLDTWPKSGDSVQLSYGAATGGSFDSFKPHGSQPIAPGGILNARRPTPWTAAQLPASDPMRPIVIFTVTGLSPKSGTGFALERLSADGQGVEERVVLDQTSGMFTKATGNTVAVLLTAGRWRFASIGDLSLCMGAPVFEAKAGEVIYGGSFDLKAASLAPSLDLAAPRAWLGAAPAGAKLQPAVYRNGSTGVCGGNVLYALEFPGAPFVEGYQWGSRAWETTQTTAAGSP